MNSVIAHLSADQKALVARGKTSIEQQPTQGILQTIGMGVVLIHC